MAVARARIAVANSCLPFGRDPENGRCPGQSPPGCPASTESSPAGSRTSSDTPTSTLSQHAYSPSTGKLCRSPWLSQHTTATQPNRPSTFSEWGGESKHQVQDEKHSDIFNSIRPNHKPLTMLTNLSHSTHTHSTVLLLLLQQLTSPHCTMTLTTSSLMRRSNVPVTQWTVMRRQNCRRCSR